MSSAAVNHEAERGVIAALIRNPDGQVILKLGISVDLFTQDATREAFSAIIALIADGIPPDAATLRNAISDAALIEVETSLKENASKANLPVYVGLLKDCHRERTVQAARDRLIKATSAGSPDHELQAILESIRRAQQSEQRKVTFHNLADLMKTPPREVWLIRSYLFAGSICVLFGDSGSGKTFVTIDILCHIAAGIPWRGSKIRQGKVLYIAGEGQNGVLQRFKAWFEFHDCQDAIDNILIRTIPAALCDKESTAELLVEIEAMPEKPLVIAIDTLARNFGPGDENSSRDMSCLISGIDNIKNVTQAAILIPHHTGHLEKTRARGSSVLKGAIDTEFHIERNGETVSLSCQKMKDSENAKSLSWTLTRQELPWVDDERVPMTSAVLVPSDAEPCLAPHCSARLSASQRIALDALKTALMEHGIEDKGVVSVAEDQWRQVAYDAGISSSDTMQDARRKAFNRARDWLVASKKVTCFDGRYWIHTTRTRPDKTGH